MTNQASHLAGLPGPSPAIVLTLLIVTIAPILIFAGLMRRWTSGRRWLTLVEWARRRGMKIVRGERARTLPRVLNSLTNGALVGKICATDRVHFVVQVERANPEPIEAAGLRRWNLLIREAARGGKSSDRVTRGSIAALRPAGRDRGESAIDLLELTPYHTMSNARFDVFATEAKAATALANSSARALLPADVGLIVCDHTVLLDFSSRPFDYVELDRMLAVAEQVAREV